jgi:hypothetical protein
VRLIFGGAIGLMEAASRDAMAAFVFSGIALAAPAAISCAGR